MAGINLIDNILGRLGLIRNSQIKSATSHLRSSPEVNLVQWFDVLERYYLNTDLYNELQLIARNLSWTNEEILGLRNPCFRTVEFYAATLWPGPLPNALPITTDNQRIVEPIKQVWKWSNLAEQKQVMTRRSAWSGSLFLKIETTDDGRPYIHCLQPQRVQRWRTDKRGFLTEIRIDTPTVVDLDGIQVTRTRTEVWDLDGVRIYETALDAGGLGDPAEVHTLDEFGIDFIPIVYAKFRDIGHWYGAPAFIHCIDKIDQINRIATRAHMLAFGKKSLWALSRTATDAIGRELPPVRVRDTDGNDLNISDIDVEAMVRLPSNTSLTSLVPNIDFSGLNESIGDFMHEIESDLPELIYYRLSEQADVSGRAIRMKLGGAIGKVIEARANLESALARADMMALTIGMRNRKFDNNELGNFDDGDLDHVFTERDVLPPDTAALLNEQVIKHSLGVPPKQLQIEIGYTEEDFMRWAQWEKEASPAAEDAADKLLTALTRRGESISAIRRASGGHGTE